MVIRLSIGHQDQSIAPPPKKKVFSERFLEQLSTHMKESHSTVVSSIKFPRSRAGAVNVEPRITELFASSLYMTRRIQRRKKEQVA